MTLTFNQHKFEQHVIHKIFTVIGFMMVLGMWQHIPIITEHAQMAFYVTALGTISFAIWMSNDLKIYDNWKLFLFVFFVGNAFSYFNHLILKEQITFSTLLLSYVGTSIQTSVSYVVIVFVARFGISK